MPVSAESVRAQLARILASDGFISSQRLCRFLRFIVERTLENDLDRLKEFVVAMEVFDRDDKYDPSIDSIVRVEARRLRTKLKSYYEGVGSSDPVLIGLRPGNYVPLFRSLTPAVKPIPSVAAVLPPRDDYTTVAVLPFVNMSPEPEQDYFCDGITEEIINALAAIESLAVVSRTSAFQFKGQAIDLRDVGRRLGVQVIVEGSVRKAGNQLRITAQAIDTGKGYHLWSETYRRELHDIFAIQEEISLAIAQTLHAKLPVRPLRGAYLPPLEAYTGFIRASHLVHQQNVPGLYAAIRQFEELTRAYPDYADPYAGVATGWAALALFGIECGAKVLPVLRRNAERAVELNPESAEGWTVMGGISAHWDFDWAEAERHFQRAISLQPSNYGAHTWYGMVLSMLGRFDQAESELAAALKLNPLAASGFGRQGFLSYLRGDDSTALQYLNESMKVAPDFPDSRLILGLVHMHRGDYGTAVEVLSRHIHEMPIPTHLGMLAGALFRAGKPDECQRLLAQLEQAAKTQYITPLAYVGAYVGMGEHDRAFAALSAAIEDRAIFVDLLNVDPYYAPLRKDARFDKLLRIMNLHGRAPVS
ncbi:MAG: tetratricopeptide repeat protein [Bryobacteraceae bacterium]|nr:tetratricopeptide repeat protein [Bryobacteraceae bacterium]